MNMAEINQYAIHMRTRNRVRSSTLKLYLYSLHQFLSATNGNEVTSESAQQYIDKMAKIGLSPSTVNTRAHAIMSYFRWKGMEVHLECPSIISAKPDYLSSAEVSQVISKCTTQLERTLVYMLIDTGVRISELLNLEVDGIDWESCTILVTRKGGRQDEVNVSLKAIKELKLWLKMRKSSSKRVFMDLDYQTAWRIIKKLGTRAGVKRIHPHIFRHTRAIGMLKSGAKLYVVQQHLGHKSISTTANIYGIFNAQDLREEIPDW